MTLNYGDVLLAEYEALKQEQLDRIKARDNYLYLTGGAIVAVCVGAAQVGSVAVLLALPLVCTLIGWVRLDNDRKVSAIGGYLRHDLAVKIRAEVGDRPVLGWETAVRRDDPGRRGRMRRHLAVDLGTYVAPGLVAVGVVAVDADHWSVLGIAAGLAGLLITLGLGEQIAATYRAERKS